MINIAHPKVSSKPPLSKCPADRKNAQNVRTANDFSSKLQEMDDLRLPEREHVPDGDASSEQIDRMIKNIGSDIKKLQSTNDCNQNVIEPNSCSFEQLCTMINDLEENIAGNNMSVDTVEMNTSNVLTKNSCDESNIFPLEYRSNRVEPEKDYSKKPCISSGSTYEDIMSFLGVLEQEGYLTDSVSDKSEVYSRNAVEDIFMNNQSSFYSNNRRSDPILSHVPVTLREDMETARLQLEERDATVTFLKNELKSQRNSACEKLETQTKKHTAELQTQKSKYQAVIKRHQKFIEQLISEKKDLTEKCNALTERIKEIEMKQQRELAVLTDRHAVELQRARELCAASEKIRRERWLEAKTSKIKEMTVKGLEPELRSMVEQHQQEIQEIRSSHIKELQDTELRTIRRSNQQLEQLRIELTASHEKILSNEKDILRIRFQEKLEQQETLFHDQRRKLLDELERERKSLAEDQTRRNAERDAAIQQAFSQFHEKMNTLTRQHQIEKKALQESLQVEKETWMENYRRQQNAKIEKMEARLRDESNCERDRQIEIAIERLEKETLEMKSSLQQSAENKLRYLKEKYEAELQDVTDSEQLLKSKVASMQERLRETESKLLKSEDKLRQCMIEISSSNEVVERMTVEKNNAKKIVRQEIETEKRELEDKIASLYRELTETNSNRDAQMAQLYSRVKLIVTQKDLTIGKISKENDEAKKKCDHLEKLLDQQRKDYVLKSL